MNTITMKLQADHLIEEALREDISSEDVTTNSVMKKAVQGEVNITKTLFLMIATLAGTP